jgi:hypothetical protein
MTLSNQTYNKLASALAPEVIDYIHKDERYVLFLQEIIPDAVVDKMGKIDDEVLFELSMCIMDKIFFTTGLYLK